MLLRKLILISVFVSLTVFAQAQLLETFNTRTGASTLTPDSVRIYLQARGWSFPDMTTNRGGVSPIEGNGSMVSSNLSNVNQNAGFITPYIQIAYTDSFLIQFVYKFNGSVTNKWFKIYTSDTLSGNVRRDSVYIGSAAGNVLFRYKKWIKGYDSRYNCRVTFAACGTGTNRIAVDSVCFSANQRYRPGNNSAPIGIKDTFEMIKNTTLSNNFITNDIDPDDDPIRLWTLNSFPDSGSLVMDNAGDGRFTYTPPIGFVGIQTFSYIPRDRGFDPLSGLMTSVVIIVREVNTLPVKLINFDGKNTDSGNELNWTTAVEISNDYFDVERSVDGKTFESIGRVDGNGNSTVLTHYQFIDAKPLAGVSYYRLHQVDYDKAFENSPIVSVKNTNGADDNISISVSPNPINLSTNSFELRGIDHCSITILNSLGEIMDNKEIQDNGTVELRTWRSQLPGVYFIQVVKGSFSQTLPLIVQ